MKHCIGLDRSLNLTFAFLQEPASLAGTLCALQSAGPPFLVKRCRSDREDLTGSLLWNWLRLRHGQIHTSQTQSQNTRGACAALVCELLSEGALYLKSALRSGRLSDSFRCVTSHEKTRLRISQRGVWMMQSLTCPLCIRLASSMGRRLACLGGICCIKPPNQPMEGETTWNC